MAVDAIRRSGLWDTVIKPPDPECERAPRLVFAPRSAPQQPAPQ